MKKNIRYIYDTKRIRCCVQIYKGVVGLSMEKRVWWNWRNCSVFLFLSESKSMAVGSSNPLTYTAFDGSLLECYIPETLNLELRIREYIKQYYKELHEDRKRLELIEKQISNIWISAY